MSSAAVLVDIIDDRLRIQAWVTWRQLSSLSSLPSACRCPCTPAGCSALGRGALAAGVLPPSTACPAGAAASPLHLQAAAAEDTAVATAGLMSRAMACAAADALPPLALTEACALAAAEANACCTAEDTASAVELLQALARALETACMCADRSLNAAM